MQSMMTYPPGDIVLVAFPYSSGAQSRTRPALIILDAGDPDVLVARITTQLYQTPHDVTVADWRRAGSLSPSVVVCTSSRRLRRPCCKDAGRLAARRSPSCSRTTATHFRELVDASVPASA